jgi:ABC-type uncharacterized transport system involved in gliding motility auxiliary subunit
MSRLQTFLAFITVITAVVLVNILASTLSKRVDLTEDRTFTLSEGSLKIISKIEEPITLELYASRSDVKLRPTWKVIRVVSKYSFVNMSLRPKEKLS